jgi:hypothetical protein
VVVAKSIPSIFAAGYVAVYCVELLCETGCCTEQPIKLMTPAIATKVIKNLKILIFILLIKFYLVFKGS